MSLVKADQSPVSKTHWLTVAVRRTTDQCRRRTAWRNTGTAAFLPRVFVGHRGKQLEGPVWVTVDVCNDFIPLIKGHSSFFFIVYTYFYNSLLVCPLIHCSQVSLCVAFLHPRLTGLTNEALPQHICSLPVCFHSHRTRVFLLLFFFYVTVLLIAAFSRRTKRSIK